MSYPEHIRNLPIPIAPPSEMKALTDYAKQELALHAKLKEARTPQDEQTIENAMKKIDKQFYAIVYKIYRLTNEEITIFFHQKKKVWLLYCCYFCYNMKVLSVGEWLINAMKASQRDASSCSKL